MDNNFSQPTNKTNWMLWFIIGSCIVSCICLACVTTAVIAGAVAFYRYDQEQQVNITPTTPASPTPIPATATLAASSTPQATVPTPTPIVSLTPTPVLQLTVPEEIDQRPIPARAYDDLARLYQVTQPIHDYYEAAIRLGQYDLGPRTTTAPTYAIGDQQSFDLDDGRIEAELVAVSEHAYFWVEEGLNYETADVQAVADRLESEYYPRLINLFGEPWNPGIDNDPRFSVLHIRGEGNNTELGYFTSVDEYPNSLYQNSNEQEMIYMVMNNLALGEELYDGTLVHEIQHLIQWYTDSNETVWLNEGLSQLTETYMGLDSVDSDYYLEQPSIQLNTWGYDEDVVDAHYGAAYLYMVYLWEQLGETAVQELARHPANGLGAVRAVLQGFSPNRTLEQFTADWAAANFLDDPAAGAAYNYETIHLRRPEYEERFKTPQIELTKTLNQFGVHYIELDFRDTVTISFAGDTVADLTDSAPRSGEQMWVVLPSDETHAQLTGAFDLSDVSKATLHFAAWYDLEEEWDFAYVTISTDGGDTWELLSPEHASPGEYGAAFNGRSADEDDAVDGWVKERISLNSYVGQRIQIRFEVLTDSAVLGRGFALDDISIPELNYQSNVEEFIPAWEAQGFVQSGWQLPQQWAVQLIQRGDTPQVIPLALNEFNQGQQTVEIEKGGAVLVIMPLTPFVYQPADYWLHIEP